jgi:OmpA-OmpF porin, OOP family
MRRVRTLVLLLLVAGINVSFAQNLVPNPGFEDFYKCPYSFNISPKDFNLPGWSSASNGTPDHFHSCSKAESSVPKNWAGVAHPHSGNGYAGLYVWGRNGKSYREYIQCKLIEPLKAGKEYRIEFYFKLSSYSKYKTDRIGLLLLDSTLALRRDKVFRVQPTLSVVKTPMEDGEWDHARMMYVAHGGETNLVIGNFYDDRSTENIRLDYRTIKNGMLSSIAYFYVDDISVISADAIQPDSVAVPDQPKSNEIFALKNTQFDFDKYDVSPVYLPELDRLISILKSKPQWNVELIGHTDDVGTEDYNVRLSRNRALSVSTYLKKRGITSSRISTTGLGKSMLLTNETDDLSRMINRRVEVQFVERQMDKQK